MSVKIAWGILGLGGIAHKFVKDLALVKESKLQAVQQLMIPMRLYMQTQPLM